MTARTSTAAAPAASTASGHRWRSALRTAIRDPVALCRTLRLPPEYEPAAVAAARAFPVFVPRGFAARMRPGDPADPLLRQVLPLADELDPGAGFARDPLQEHSAGRGPGLLHKYAGRALMITTGACAVHCRYCFRRYYPYAATGRGRRDWASVVARVRADPSLEELILSGGDPLIADDRQLAELARDLAGIPHLRRLRVHTRLPIMIPERVTPELLAGLCGTRLTPLMVVHANHPREIDDAVGQALRRFVEAGVPTLNQAVLLRGINDRVDTLAELSARLLDCRVIPYYLHQLDRVAGAAHFEVPEGKGRRIIRELRKRLPGYAIPRYVREVPGAASKVELA